MDDDAIKRFFADLDPEQFASPAAGAGVSMPEPALVAADGFERFVEMIQEAAASAYATDGRDIDPVSFIARPDTTARYEPVEDETIAEYYRRLRHEAARWEATMFATAMRCPSAPCHVDVDARDQASIDEKKMTGELTYNLVWFAESVDPSCMQVRCGLWLIDDTTDALLPMIEAAPASAPDLFLAVLHPEVRL